MWIFRVMSSSAIKRLYLCYIETFCSSFVCLFVFYCFDIIFGRLFASFLICQLLRSYLTGCPCKQYNSQPKTDFWSRNSFFRVSIYHTCSWSPSSDATDFLTSTAAEALRIRSESINNWVIPLTIHNPDIRL